MRKFPLRRRCEGERFGHQTTALRGFTLIEIVIVFGILGVLVLFLGRSTGAVQFWRDESFLRILRERIEFLHYRAVSDQLYYQMEISLQSNSYRIGVLRDEEDVNTNVGVSSDENVGELSLELAAFLNPSLANGGTLIPPPTFPSLYEWVSLPMGSRIDAIRTRQRLISRNASQSVFLVFYPRGFSDFAVIHLTLASRGLVTIVVNPFTGLTQMYPGHRDFRWTYGKNKS